MEDKLKTLLQYLCVHFNFLIGEGQAHGLCFSVQKGVPTPPSLKNMIQELKNDPKLNISSPSHGIEDNTFICLYMYLYICVHVCICIYHVYVHIYKRVYTFINICIWVMTCIGNLNCWASQGVLMINTCMTVRKGEPNSHQNKGWRHSPMR